MDAYADNWAGALGVGGNGIGVVLIDAWHDLESVRSDLRGALALQTPQFLIFDDWDTSAGVRNAVQEAVAAGQLGFLRHMGQGAEGALCRVLRTPRSLGTPGSA